VNTAATAPMDIHSALISMFLEAVPLLSPALPATSFSYPQKDFTPPANAPWMGIHMLGDDRFVSSLGDNGQDGWQGIMQIDIYVPENDGPKRMNGYLGTLLYHFRAGTRISYNGQVVVIRRSSPSSVRKDGASDVKSVSVYWSSWTQR
jgi:hypothetical protein